ncbi:hypothetical protein J7L13_02905 [bacterium]|nr:hypothetical protein [bacterium]
MKKPLLSHKSLFVWLVLAGGVFIFGLGLFRLWQIKRSTLQYPLRVERRLKALKEGRNSWEYDTSTLPLPLKQQR